LPSPVKSLNLFETETLTFGRPDLETFKCLAVCIEAARRGGLYTAAASGAGEQAVDLFLNGKIGFNDIGDLVEAAAFFDLQSDITESAVYEVDKKARCRVLELADVLIK
jgi:1-deoxy-D-xylulose-5-phosphate reductoisomerase